MAALNNRRDELGEAKMKTLLMVVMLALVALLPAVATTQEDEKHL